MDNVQEHNKCTNLPSSQTFRSYHMELFHQSPYVVTASIRDVLVHSLSASPDSRISGFTNNVICLTFYGAYFLKERVDSRRGITPFSMLSRTVP
jgi:hypothetical protein